jgi:two-component system chemotaxis sensor kinase CheA
VQRIESIKASQIESVGLQKFVTLYGVSTRVLFLDQLLDVSSSQPAGDLHIILPKFVKEPMGIAVNRIVDTQSLSIDLQRASIDQPGILGSALIQEKLCLFLDIQYLRSKAFPNAPEDDSNASIDGQRQLGSSKSVDGIGSAALQASAQSAHLLLVDDTPFFREVVKRYLEAKGFRVCTAVDGLDALQKSESNHFDLIVSDIEMPNMNGWDFCREIRKRGYTGPMIALTSLSKLENEQHAAQCGFDTFEEKLDHDRLIGAVYRTLKNHAERASMIGAVE